GSRLILASQGLTQGNWVVGLDVNSIGNSICFSNGVGSPTCPCGNFGQYGRGCGNSTAGSMGALLLATGTTNPDTVVLHATEMIGSALCVFLQGDVQVSPVSFGDGVRCVGGSLKRLYNKNAFHANADAPRGAELSITAQSAALGDPIAPGSSRYYQ